ncbi:MULTISPECIES: DUF3298 and DUF4163 domain-containing protein [unclassified Sphingobium]|uniref:DUF3298 and DUF4163 domain-containing protein n=1 Tax=unclassified Sphingobium TaxID=2611147 RepID=UPI0022259F76|nr:MULTISPECIES: DUF3298 and DUF4163 domain-containing protein [unclassified Sphingobium]MCW2382512.1 hypothetical protein [Sphingobium sp. B2D3B]MCW2397315.1 hypothetical protein [Sphingobium sp. B2D3C]
MAPIKSTALLSLCIALAACGNETVANNMQVPVENAVNVAEPANAMQANAVAGKSVAFTKGESEFRVSWPAAAAAIAPLDAMLQESAEKQRKETEDGIRAEEASAKEAGYPFRGYSYTEDWSVAADVPTLLVLRSEGYSYTGGAHGMPLVKVLYWDKAGNKALEAGDLFDIAALGRAVKDRFCAALNAERTKRRGEPVGSGEGSPIPEFDQCVDPTKQTIIAATSGGGALNRLHFVIMPYEAGPYAEGIYEIEVPVDAAVLGAVKPAWKGAFAAAQ